LNPEQLYTPTFIPQHNGPSVYEVLTQSYGVSSPLCVQTKS